MDDFTRVSLALVGDCAMLNERGLGGEPHILIVSLVTTNLSAQRKGVPTFLPVLSSFIPLSPLC